MKLPNICNAGKPWVTNQFANCPAASMKPGPNLFSISVSTGNSALPICSLTLPRAFFMISICPVMVLPAATAEPPICVSSSFRISACAPAASPASTMLLIISFWSAVNWTPARLSAVMPAIGSFSAFPTIIVADCRSMPNAVDRSSVACVARGKTSLPTLVNVSITALAARIASSSKRVTFDSASACASSASRVMPAAPPVDLNTASSCAETSSAACASLTDVANTAPSAPMPATATPTPAINPPFSTAPSRPALASIALTSLPTSEIVPLAWSMALMIMDSSADMQATSCCDVVHQQYAQFQPQRWRVIHEGDGVNV